jgi:hypothetical protein
MSIQKNFVQDQVFSYNLCLECEGMHRILVPGTEQATSPYGPDRLEEQVDGFFVPER